ncbi:unnamed protein product [Prorocentrum cordatum]|uniref:Uncharacterized protein n=1 Tax=Prorocentrum cordatum TaxID=2364126 RepID=A0ABN9R640_9DINO|nr:unnamed protein product [Polarella glacialis]
MIGLGLGWNVWEPRDGFYAGTAVGVPRLSIPSTNMQGAGQGFRTFEPEFVGTVPSWPSGLSMAAARDQSLLGRDARGGDWRRVPGPGVSTWSSDRALTSRA